MTVETTFAVSGQHYLFNVQTFAHTVLALGGDAYAYALRDRTTQGVIDDVAGGKSDLGVLFQTSATADEVNAALDAAGLEFVELIQSAPRVALPKSHPMVNASSLSLEDMEDFPYLYFEQDEDSPVAFAEEALASVPRAKSIACTDRASLSELIVALNGYTVTSGILVGISDGAGLNTVPLDTDVKLHLGYVVRKGEALSDIGQRFVDTLKKNLEKYAGSRVSAACRPPGNKADAAGALAPHLRAIPQARVPKHPLRGLPAGRVSSAIRRSSNSERMFHVKHPRVALSFAAREPSCLRLS